LSRYGKRKKKTKIGRIFAVRFLDVNGRSEIDAGADRQTHAVGGSIEMSDNAG
jgi:hypothetical protein